MTNHTHDFTARQVSGRYKLFWHSCCACGLSEPMAWYLGQHPETERGTVETDMGRGEMPEDDDLDTVPCPGCGDGDRAPATGYWRCPVCDAEWFDENSDEAASLSERIDLTHKPAER